MLLKLLVKNSFTKRPTSLGTSFPLFDPKFSETINLLILSVTTYCNKSLFCPTLSPLKTYFLFIIVEIVGAYVEGLPIPSSSNFLTRVASENLKGGFEKT